MTAGVIGICPPCTRATPLTGVWPSWLVGFLAQGFLHSPTGQQGHAPVRGVALVHGGQIPISLEYQINPPSTHI